MDIPGEFTRYHSVTDDLARRGKAKSLRYYGIVIFPMETHFFGQIYILES